MTGAAAVPAPSTNGSSLMLLRAAHSATGWPSSKQPRNGWKSGAGGRCTRRSGPVVDHQLEAVITCLLVSLDLGQGHVKRAHRRLKLVWDAVNIVAWLKWFVVNPAFLSYPGESSLSRDAVLTDTGKML